jgi:nitrogen fixation/metabolism regulation signal transduction histidine kinase
MLLKGTQAVAEGDLSPKPEINTGDELGLLTRQFNNMTRQLSDARESLQESKDFSESILANLTAGVCVLDVNYNLLVANAGAKRILERDLTPIIGKPLGSIPELAYFEETIREAYRANHVSVGGEEAPADTPTDPLVGNGQRTWQKQIQLHPSVDEDDINSAHTLLARGTKLASGQLIVVFDDITEVIVAQRSVAWGEVARRLAHEIKNPLTPIQLSAERILHKLTGKIEPEQEEILSRSTKTIINQVQAMKQMVNDFRDFAKTPTPVLQPLDLNGLVLEILGLYEGSKINVKIDESCPKIMGDPTQLRQVIHNVLQNAQDACLDKGNDQQIEVRTEAVKYEVEPGLEEQMVRFTVVDNGPGLPPRILSRAFEPYVTSKAKGTGLGLAVVKKILDEHGARIEIKNREKDGVILGAKISILFNRLASKNSAEN